MRMVSSNPSQVLIKSRTDHSLATAQFHDSAMDSVTSILKADNKIPENTTVTVQNS